MTTVGARLLGRAGLALMLVLAACGPPELPVGHRVVDSLAPDEPRTYRSSLEAGRHYRWTVTEDTADLALRLEGPDPRLPLAFDTLRSGPKRGDELVEIVSPVTADYRLEVGTTVEGRQDFSLLLEDLGPAGELERARIDAAWLFADAEGHRRSQNPEAGRGLYSQALERFRGLGDRGGEGAVLERLAMLPAADTETQIEHLDASAAAYQDADRALDLARVLARRLRVERRSGNPNAALETAEELLELARRIEDPYSIGIALGHLGRLLRRVGNFGGAVARLGEAMEIWRAMGHRNLEGVVLVELGETHLQQGDPERAREVFEAALEIFESLGQQRNGSRTRISLGTAWLRLGDLQRAEVELRRALDEVLALGDLAGEAAARNDLGSVLFRQERLVEAREETERALEIYRQLDDGPGRTTANNSLGRIYDAEGHSDLAAEHYQAALALARDRGDRSNEASALIGLARLERRLGQLDTARATLDSALEVVEGLRVDTVDGRARALYLAYRHDYFAELVGLLMDLARERPGEDYVARALEVGERARGRVLGEILLASRWGVVATAEQQARRRQWIEEHSRVRLRLESVGAADRRELLHRLGEIEAELRALDDAILRDDPRASELLAPQPFELAPLRAEMPDDLQVLVFALAKPRSYLYLLEGDGIEVFELEAAERLEGVARRAHQALARGYIGRHGLSAERDLEILGRWLLGPVIGRLDRERLVVVADGALRLLPFAALPDPRHGRPLVEDFEIVRAVSLGSEALLGATWPTTSLDRMAIVADPIFDCQDQRTSGDCDASRYPRLQSSETWLEAMMARIDPANSLLLVGPEARYEEVLSAPMGRFPILHFYTHAEVDNRYPERSHLVLSRVDRAGRRLDRHLLTYHDIRQLDLGNDLVVLGGCKTALGQEVRGEGFLGLTHAFFQAGAARVMASLWSVRDTATAELMNRFYDRLLVAGETPSSALRHAQRAVRDDPRTAAPFYWAGFELYGPME